jgi:hypothetical protein
MNHPVDFIKLDRPENILVCEGGLYIRVQQRRRGLIAPFWAWSSVSPQWTTFLSAL